VSSCTAIHLMPSLRPIALDRSCNTFRLAWITVDAFCNATSFSALNCTLTSWWLCTVLFFYTHLDDLSFSDDEWNDDEPTMLAIAAPASGSGGKTAVRERDFEAEMDAIMGDETSHLKRKMDEFLDDNDL
jgi:hypothetical protein